MLNNRYKVNRYINALIENGYIDVLEKGNYLESLNYKKAFIYKDSHTIYFKDKWNTSIIVWNKEFTLQSRTGSRYRKFYNNKDLIEYANNIILSYLNR